MSPFGVLPLLLSLVSGHSIFTESCCHADDGLLYPVPGETRETLLLDGVWKLRFAKPFDPEEGFRDSWYSRPLDENASVFRVPVPSNYPTLTFDPDYFYSTDGRKAVPTFYPGWVWYEREFILPSEWEENGRRVILRVGAAHYHSIVYVNGQKVAQHEGGSVPFAVELTTALSPAQLRFGPAEKSRLTIATNSSLSPETIPQGLVVVASWYNPPRLEQRDVNQNYWKYGGIHGSVTLYTTPKTFIQDINVTTSYEGGVGYVNYSVLALRKLWLNTSTGNMTLFCCCRDSFRSCHFRVELIDNGGHVVASSEGPPIGVLAIQKPHLWWPYTLAPDDEVGYLYTLQVRLTDEETLEQDVYNLHVGIRTVAWTDNRLCVNDRPFNLRGILRGVCQKNPSCLAGAEEVRLARLSVWDFSRYMKTNSMRGLYYPLTEDTIRAADQQGFVIISEVPAVNLKHFGTHLLNLHKEILRQLVRRDKNSPSVLIFSLANLVDDVGTGMALESDNYFRALTEYGRGLDPQNRPLAVTVRAQNLKNSAALKHMDIVGLSWQKNAVVGKKLLELNQTAIMEDIIEWSAQQRRERRKPLLFVAEHGVYPTQLYSEACSLAVPYERDVLDEFHAIFDQLEANSEVALIGEMNWTCDSGRFSITSHTNDKYFCSKIHQRFANKSLVQKK